MHRVPKILLVDDFRTMRALVKSMLKGMDIEFLEASDGKDALSLLNKFDDFNLIISDWNMPRMTGIALLKAVRADKNLKNLKFLMVTAESIPNQINEALSAKVTGYITKPFRKKELIEKVLELLKSTTS